MRGDFANDITALSAITGMDMSEKSTATKRRLLDAAVWKSELGQAPSDPQSRVPRVQTDIPCLRSMPACYACIVGFPGSKAKTVAARLSFYGVIVAASGSLARRVKKSVFGL